MVKALLKIITGSLLFTFIGIKYDTEFYEPEFFFKHKPNLKIEYFSPVGESDLALEDLSGSRKKAEVDYREFVGNYYERDFIDNLAFPLIPLMSWLLLSGILKLLGLIRRTHSAVDYLIHLVLLFVAFATYWNLHIPGSIMICGYWIFGTFSIVLIDRKYQQ